MSQTLGSLNSKSLIDAGIKTPAGEILQFLKTIPLMQILKSGEFYFYGRKFSSIYAMNIRFVSEIESDTDFVIRSWKSRFIGSDMSAIFIDYGGT